MPFTVSGIDSLSSKLLSSPRRVEDEVWDELRDAGDDVKEESQRRAPLGPPEEEDSGHPGALRDAAYSKVDRGPGGPSLEVGYEGLPYIIVQHEGGWRNLVAWGKPQGPTRIKQWTTPGTGPKYLESAWLERKPRIIAGVREATRRALRG